MTSREWMTRVMYAGLAMTVVATAVPYLDCATANTLADHIRAGYPSYSSARIETAATTYLVYLSAIGVLGVGGWLWSIHAVRNRQRWSRPTATALFVAGAAVALTDLLIKDTSGAAGLSPLIGWVGLVPSLPGLLATTLMWRSKDFHQHDSK